MEKLLLTGEITGVLALCVLATAYLLVIFETRLGLSKSKPVLLAGCIIWLLIALAYTGTGHEELVETAFRHTLLDYAEILLFLLVAMTYINVLEERHVFEALRSQLVARGFSLRQLFWITGGLAFCISPVADNMTTALLMGAVVVAVGGSNTYFVSAACINVVVAANAGGAFSPFGDITTLMVWQREKLTFWEFFHLVPAAVVTWVIPAAWMAYGITDTRAPSTSQSIVPMREGAIQVIGLFFLTIAIAVASHSLLHLPPVFGMLFGLALLKFFGYYMKLASTDDMPFDVFHHVQRIEWDTLLFFGGIILAVGGIGFIGYLELLSNAAYQPWSGLSQEQATTFANISVGILSAIVDNIPLMFAVLEMDPAMSDWQWLLVTLTAGVGGSLLSIGSAAGVALMGTAKTQYTFASHLRATPVIALGYAAGILTHYLYAQIFASYLF